MKFVSFHLIISYQVLIVVVGSVIPIEPDMDETTGARITNSSSLR